MFPNFEKFTLMKQTETTTSDSTSTNTLLAVSSPSPYSIMDILPLLIKATEILLYKKDYDGHDYEQMMEAVKYSKLITFRAASASGEVDKTVSVDMDKVIVKPPLMIYEHKDKPEPQ